MKTRLNLILISLWLATTVNSPACLNCIRLAQQGLSSPSLDGQAYDGTPVHLSSFNNPAVMDSTSATAVSNAPVEKPETNAVAAMTFTNGANIGFNVLAGYTLNLSPELENSTNGASADVQVNAMIPANIHALNHREFSVEGFMIPAQFEKDKVVEFLLSCNPPACCYGGVPKINEWIKVRVKSPGVEPEDYHTVRAHGTLSVGAERVDGSLVSIYRMEAGKVEVMP